VLTQDCVQWESFSISAAESLSSITALIVEAYFKVTCKFISEVLILESYSIQLS
jgi:hypothetical protein